MAVAALCGLTVQAGERTWYAAIEGGMEFGDVTAHGLLSGLCGPLGSPCAPDLSLDTGWAVNGSIGANVGKNIRLEAELGYASQVFGGTGDLTHSSIMANALYDIPMAKGITVSLGAGLGFERVTTDMKDLTPPLGLSDHSSSFAFQGLIGVAYELSESLDLTLNYRYLNASGHDELFAKVDGTPSNWGAVVRDVDARSELSVGLRFGF
ncbi:MAG: porin family protein [Alphaproteobacteria bacterium]|nr:porin family protein [Alphaproteobacteria bacterium]